MSLVKPKLEGTEISTSKPTFDKLRKNILLFVFLCVCAFIINKGYKLSGLYMDDLYNWSCFGEQSFLEFVFPTDSTRCRFVYWAASWLELFFIGNDIPRILTINIVLNTIIAFIVYGFCKEISNSTVAGVIVAILYLASPFSYYQISQLLGLMESMATLFSLCIIICLYKYLEIGKYFYHALVFYFLCVFTHERFIVLLPLFIFVLMTRRDEAKKYICTFVLFAIILAIRMFFIGTLSPAGTGGTNVEDTFTWGSMIKSFAQEILYMACINMGPEYLCGVPWESYSSDMKTMSIMILAAYIIIFIWGMMIIRRARLQNYTLAKILLFVGAIGGTVLSSSVTIRVELRWIYVPFTILMFLMVFMITKVYVFNRDGCFASLYNIIFFGVAMLILCMQINLRAGTQNIYLYENQRRCNSLADVTYGVYGDELFEKDIYIVENSYEMSEFNANTFFKTFDKNRVGCMVYFVDTVEDIEIVDDNVLVLVEDAEHDAYIDITDELSST